MRYLLALTIIFGVSILSSCGRKGERCPSVGKTITNNSEIKVS